MHWVQIVPMKKSSTIPVKVLWNFLNDLFRSNGLVSLHVDRGDTDEVSFKIA